jgi:DeoR/GlpR family transcriptional regulator of sugar metabolism
LLIKAPRQRIGLAEHTKFDRQSFAFVGPTTHLDTPVTDAGVDQEYVERIRRQGLRVITENIQSPNSVNFGQQRKNIKKMLDK